MIVVSIYHLEKFDCSIEDLDIIKENTKADLVVTFLAENQLEGIQYPYMTVDYYDSKRS